MFRKSRIRPPTVRKPLEIEHTVRYMHETADEVRQALAASPLAGTGKLPLEEYLYCSRSREYGQYMLQCCTDGFVVMSTEKTDIHRRAHRFKISLDDGIEYHGDIFGNGSQQIDVPSIDVSGMKQIEAAATAKYAFYGMAGTVLQHAYDGWELGEPIDMPFSSCKPSMTVMPVIAVEHAVDVDYLLAGLKLREIELIQ